MTTRFADPIIAAFVAVVPAGALGWFLAELFGRHGWIDAVATVVFVIVWIAVWVILHFIRPSWDGDDPPGRWYAS